MFKHILLPTDGSELSLKAVQMGVDLAKACGASVVALYVVAPVQAIAFAEMAVPADYDYTDEAAGRAQRYLDDAKAIAEKAGVALEQIVVYGLTPSLAILHTATDRKCDLIAMASHSRHGLSRMMMGSETHKVILKSEVPVLVCH